MLLYKSGCYYYLVIGTVTVEISKCLSRTFFYNPLESLVCIGLNASVTLPSFPFSMNILPAKVTLKMFLQKRCIELKSVTNFLFQYEHTNVDNFPNSAKTTPLLPAKRSWKEAMWYSDKFFFINILGTIAWRRLCRYLQHSIALMINKWLICWNCI